MRRWNRPNHPCKRERQWPAVPRIRNELSMRTLRILAIAAGLAAAASAQAPPGPQSNPPATAGALPPPQSSPVIATANAQQGTPPSAPLKTNTRLIAVDVVVTDSHGNAIRGLKAGDFQISEEHSGPQKISQFQFIDATSHPAPVYPAGLIAASPGAPYLYTNLLPEKMRVPPTVMLMDALNTQIENQSEVHRHMLMLLKTLPPSTPIAVFVLTRTLHVVQSFTTDPGLLRAAVDKTLRPPDIEQNPQDDPNSMSNAVLDQNGDTETPANLALEDFEKTEYEFQMALRVDETTDAMVSIAKFLGGYPGRKNLLWFSESFPNWIAPTADFGSDSFAGTANYADKIRHASEALADARIAVYPVDARGLEASQLYSVGQNPHINRNNPGAGFGGQLSRESSTRIDTQSTMQQLAEATGGKICVNTNDLSGCVEGALDDSSVYYELAYYPENVKWDGRFHKLTVKTSEHGIRLRYRGGYVAIEPDAQLKPAPAKLLQQACLDPLPSTSISVTAEALTPKTGASNAGGARYLLTIAPTSLSLAPAGADRELSLQMAICEYDAKGDSFEIFPGQCRRRPFKAGSPRAFEIFSTMTRSQTIAGCDLRCWTCRPEQPGRLTCPRIRARSEACRRAPRLPGIPQRRPVRRMLRPRALLRPRPRLILLSTFRLAARACLTGPVTLFPTMAISALLKERPRFSRIYSPNAIIAR